MLGGELGGMRYWVETGHALSLGHLWTVCGWRQFVVLGGFADIANTAL